jgi:hypothetical protein
MLCRIFRATGAGAIALAASFSAASAHCVVGNRFFPATLAIDDPCVADELSLPTVSWTKSGDIPPVREIDISAEFSKRITDNFGISISPTWTHLRVPGGPNASGFQNLETSFKYQFLTVPSAEFVMSASVDVEWGGTGAAQVGADRFSTITPTLFAGKGFGELPDAVRWLRPFAVTGQAGYAIPTSSRTITGFDADSGLPNVDQNPSFWVYGASLQYSMPYLKSHVIDLGLPDVVNRLIFLVEAQFSTPAANNQLANLRTTGTINPGVVYTGDKYQLAVEAIVPINRDSGGNVGVIAQLHLYLDDIFPQSIGRPLLASR